jgi:hypothetical protein
MLVPIFSLFQEFSGTTTSMFSFILMQNAKRLVDSALCDKEADYFYSQYYLLSK